MYISAYGANEFLFHNEFLVLIINDYVELKKIYFWLVLAVGTLRAIAAVVYAAGGDAECGCRFRNLGKAHLHDVKDIVAFEALEVGMGAVGTIVIPGVAVLNVYYVDKFVF